MAEEKKLEKDIQREICEWLSDQKDLLFWRSNNIPVYAKSNDGKKRFRAMPRYSLKGLPDIMIIKDGKFIGLEVKRPGGNWRDEQKIMAQRITEAGGRYHLVMSLQEAKEALYHAKN